MTKLKYIFLIATIACQFGAIIFIFIDLKVSIALVIGNVVAFIILILLVIKERLKEKKEEEEHDYSDY